MSAKSAPRPTIAAWWLTASVPSSALRVASGSRRSAQTHSALGVGVGGPAWGPQPVQGVERAHPVAGCHQLVDHVRADESRAPGNQHAPAHQIVLTPDWIAIAVAAWTPSSVRVVHLPAG